MIPSSASIPRAGLAVATAFLAMSALALLVFPASLWLVGASAAVNKDGEPTRAWLGISAVLGFAVALLGGAVCRRLSTRRGALESLAGLCVCLGVARALASLCLVGAPEPADDRVLAALSLVHAPNWSLWLDPALDLLGIYCGGRLTRPAARETASREPTALEA